MKKDIKCACVVCALWPANLHRCIYSISWFGVQVWCCGRCQAEQHCAARTLQKRGADGMPTRHQGRGSSCPWMHWPSSKCVPTAAPPPHTHTHVHHPQLASSHQLQLCVDTTWSTQYVVATQSMRPKNQLTRPPCLLTCPLRPPTPLFTTPAACRCAGSARSRIELLCQQLPWTQQPPSSGCVSQAGIGHTRLWAVISEIHLRHTGEEGGDCQ